MVVKERREPTTQEEFKQLLSKKFLPSTFEVMYKRNALQEKEIKTMENYINPFSITCLKFTSHNHIMDVTKM